jgi:hypothetical protein
MHDAEQSASSGTGQAVAVPLLYLTKHQPGKGYTSAAAAAAASAPRLLFGECQ